MQRVPRRLTMVLVAALGAWVAIVVVAAGGCAERMGNRTVTGAVEALRAQASADPEQQVARVAAGRAVEGAVGALDQPEQRAQLQRTISEAVEAAVASALASALGPEAPEARSVAPQDRGPAEVLVARLAAAATEDALAKLSVDLAAQGRLATSISQTSAAVSASAVRSAVDELIPGCTGPDAPACRQRRVEELTRAAAMSFTSGLRDSIGWPLLIAALALGVVCGSFGHWLWSLHLRTKEFRTV